MVESDWDLLCNTVRDPAPGLTAVEISSPAYASNRISALQYFLPDSPSVILPLFARRGNASALTREATEACQAWEGQVGTIFFIDQGVDSDQESVADFWREMNARREFWGNLDCHILFFLLPYNYDLFLKLANHLADWMSLRVHLIEPLTDDCSQIEFSLPADDLSPDVAKQLLSALEPGLREALKRGEPAKNLIHDYYLPMLKAAVAIPDLHRAEGLSSCIDEENVDERDRLEWLRTKTKLSLLCSDYDDITTIAEQYLAEAKKNDNIKDQLSAMHAIGYASTRNGDVAFAEEWFTRAVHLYDEEGSPPMLEGALIINDLAEVLRIQAQYKEAENFYKRSLDILNNLVGLSHPYTAIVMNNLALCYESIGLYDEAEPLFAHALNIVEKDLGEHPDTANILINLASIRRARGEYAKIEPLLTRALSIFENSFGFDNPRTAICLNNLAELYRIQGHNEKAESLYKRSLEIREKALGPDHHEVATALNNLAICYSEQGKYSEAENLYQRASAIDERVFGTEHPNVALDKNNLAGLFRDQGRYSDAEPLFRRALTILENSLGPDHPHTKAVKNNLQQLPNRRNSP